MTPHFKPAGEIPLEALASGAGLFGFSFPGPTPEMLDSVRSAGVVSPLSVVARKSVDAHAPGFIENSRAEYVVVSGERRRLAALDAGLKTVPAVEMMPNGAPLITAFDRNLAENAGFRAITDIEAASALKILAEKWSHATADLAEKYLPMLNRHPARKTVGFLLRLANLPHDTKMYIHETGIPLMASVRFDEFGESGQKALISLLKTIGAGRNVAREILEEIADITRRDTIPPEKIILDPDIEAIMNDESIQTPRKADLIRRRIAVIRRPKLESILGEIAVTARELGLPVGGKIGLRPPKNLEGEKFTVEFTAGSAGEFVSAVEKLAEAAKNKDALARLFKIGKNSNAC